MPLQPWFKVAQPREDLVLGKPLDAAEFAVHLDDIRLNRAAADYLEPKRFFERTFLTANLTTLATEVIRRLSGETLETSAVFNLATQFGGGKTHALTLLYHLARGGAKADQWPGVRKLLERAGISTNPEAATAVFVGNEFDAIKGRGGDDGTPFRRTIWGEIAVQLGNGSDEYFRHVAEHDRELTPPGGDVIREMLPADRPCLILVDELMNFISRFRKQGIPGPTYHFLHNLSEVARGRKNIVMAVSIPKSELEMTSEDEADFTRISKLLERVGKSVVMSSEREASEIIRRRLFEFDANLVDREGKGIWGQEAVKVCNEYADWVQSHRHQLPGWFPVDSARDEFLAAYPFHPLTLSVFERKWQTLPTFQRTRGILKLFALWVSEAYRSGYAGAHKDPLITLGTAPLENSLFRTATLGQLGENRLEGTITTDICGKSDSHAVRFDNEAIDAIKKTRLHRKVAATIFFESNGGQASNQATEPEIRLAVGEPGLDIGNVETVLNALVSSSYYLAAENKKYWFSLSPNLNKLLADRRANISAARILERAKTEIREVFSKGPSVDRVYFPEKSNAIPDRPQLTFAILSPEFNMTNDSTHGLLESLTRESGSSARTFKSGIVWCVPDNITALNDEIRKMLAWEDIDDEREILGLDDSQRRRLSENLKSAKSATVEFVWRTYRNLFLLDKQNQLQRIDLGQMSSSSSTSLTEYLLFQLKKDGEVEETISPQFLIRNWPPAFTEWSTRSVRDAFFSSPIFPKLLDPKTVRDVIARGVGGGQFAYVGKTGDGKYEPAFFKSPIGLSDIEISDDMFIVRKEQFEARTKTETEDLRIASDSSTGEPLPKPESVSAPESSSTSKETVTQPAQNEFNFGESFSRASWSGEIPPQKWTLFYNKVITKQIGAGGLTISVRVEIEPDGGIPAHRVEEIRNGLRELGLKDLVELIDKREGG
jgi:hypothetical protein